MSNYIYLCFFLVTIAGYIVGRITVRILLYVTSKRKFIRDLKVGQIYETIEENPFKLPYHIEILDIKAGWIKYKFTRNLVYFKHHYTIKTKSIKEFSAMHRAIKLKETSNETI